MKKLFFAMGLWVLSTSTLWAQDGGTPVPAVPDTGLSSAPPALPDLSQIELPPPPVVNSNSQQAVPTDTPVPAVQAAPPPLAVPTNTPEPAMPTPTEELSLPTAVPEANTAPESNMESSTASSPSQGGILDYFPITQGQTQTYEYLKPALGQTEKKTRVVECLERQTMANGTVRVTLKTTEGSQVFTDKYSIFDNKVQHTFAGKLVLKDHLILQYPSASGPVEWQIKGGDGLTHAYKALFGQAQVYQKVYPDCVIIVDKALSGGKPVSTKIDYYAKGIGLVAVETYAPGMKLIQTESLALVEPGN
jgi:hypothetical protein